DPAAPGAAPGTRELYGEPRGLAHPPRHGEHRPARVRVLLGARAGASSSVRLLRRRVHAAARALRHRRTHRSGRVPRYRRADLRPESGDGQRPADRARRGTMRSCVLALLLVSAVCRSAAAQPASRILVMPFENVKREGRLFWLTEASSVVLTEDLNALGASAITRRERLQAFER